MKAIVYTKYGPPEVLQLKKVLKPTPKDDAVLIRTYAATVIAGDCELRSFKFPVLSRIDHLEKGQEGRGGFRISAYIYGEI